METWPDILRPQRGGRPIYVPRNVGGTVALSGFNQVVSSGAGTWKFVYEGVPIRGSATIQVWDALTIRLEGRLNPFLVRLCEGRRQPFPEGAEPYGAIPHSDDSFFSDGSGYTQPVIVAEVAESAALNATTLAIDVTYGAALLPSQFFSIGVRLYQIRNVLSVEGTVTTVRFLPPLREAVEAGDTIEFDRPVCKVRLAADDAMDRVLDQNRLGALNVAMLEDPS